MTITLDLPAWMPKLRGLASDVGLWSAESHRAAAVGAVFLPPSAAFPTARIIFIRRAKELKSHSWQIGFPGGKREAGERSPVETFLRELNEEIGVPPEMVRIYGQLAKQTSLAGAEVVPIVASLESADLTFVLDEREVESLHSVEWDQFSGPSTEYFGFTIFGLKRTSPVYFAGNVRVWGLTAKILAEAHLTK